MRRRLANLFGLGLGRGLALAAAVVACGEPVDGRGVEPSPADAAVPRPTIVVYSCESIDGERCDLGAVDDAEVDLWIDQPAGARVVVRRDGVVDATVTVRASDGGQHVTVAVPVAATRLRIEGVEPPWAEAFDLAFARAPVAGFLREIDALVARGELEAAQARLSAHAGDDPSMALEVQRRLRNIAVQQQRFDDALALAAREADLARQLGRHGAEARAASVAFNLHYQRGDLEGAALWSARTVEASRDLPVMASTADFDRGLLASALGDLVTAEAHFASASRLAQRVDDVGMAFSAGEPWAIALAELGRATEARDVARRTTAMAIDPSVPCAERAEIHVNAAWTAIRLAQAGMPYDPPHDLLDATLDDVGEGGHCPHPFQAENARINQALIHLLEDEPELAFEIVEQLRANDDPAWTPWVEELTAAVGVATGRWAQVPELEPPRQGDPVLTWLAALRYAEQLERHGLDDAAIDAYAALEGRLDRAVRAVGVEANQERFLATRSIGARRLVDLLSRVGRRGEALCRARLAAARAVHSADRKARTAALTPEQRAAWTAGLVAHQQRRAELEASVAGDWQLSGDKLEHERSRRADRLQAADAEVDALLGIDPAPRTCASLRPATAREPLLVAFEAVADTVVFLADGDVPREIRIPAGAELDRWGVELDAPLAALGDAERLTVVALGTATAIPIHALRVDGRVLVSELPIAYGLDLVARGPVVPVREALIVADPGGDLDAASREAEQVEPHLRRAGWDVVIRRGPAASRAGLLGALSGAGLLHYAGHGVRGEDPWDSALRLADDGVLRIADILTQPVTPSRVVLAGCHTGARDRLSVTGGLNLGRAFVLAGAEQVLVADGAVDDEVTLALSAALYDRGSPDDLPQALRRAQAVLRERGIDGWDGFRVLVR